MNEQDRTTKTEEQLRKEITRQAMLRYLATCEGKNYDEIQADLAKGNIHASRMLGIPFADIMATNLGQMAELTLYVLELQDKIKRLETEQIVKA